MDSVPIVELAMLNPDRGSRQSKAGQTAGAGTRRGQLRDLAMIFILFLVVVSDFFANNVLSRFGTKTMEGRSASAWGVVLQGACLAIGYAVLVHLDEQQII